MSFRARLPVAWFLSVLMTVLALAGMESAGARGQGGQDRPPALLLILDASGSMQAQLGGGTRLSAAKEALRKLVGAVPRDSLIGLRVYGDRTSNENQAAGCRDTRLVIPVGRADRSSLRARIARISARGFTPIGRSLLQGARDLPGKGSRTIVLVSDGISTCKPPPCKVANRLRAREVRVDVVGFRVGGAARKQLRCIARAGGGRYVDARSARVLSERLERLSLRPLRSFEPEGTPAQGEASPDGAPVLRPGTYSDRFTGTDRWYAVRLQPNQLLRATATIGSAGGGLDPGSFGVRIYTPQRLSPRAARGIVDVQAGVTSATSTAVTGRIAGDDPSSAWSQPGVHYVRVTLLDPQNGRSRHPMQLDLTVRGEPLRAEVEAPPEPQPSKGWIGILIAVIVAGVLFGAAFAYAARMVFGS